VLTLSKAFEYDAFILYDAPLPQLEDVFYFDFSILYSNWQFLESMFPLVLFYEINTRKHPVARIT